MPAIVRRFYKHVGSSQSLLWLITLIVQLQIRKARATDCVVQVFGLLWMNSL